MGPKAAPEVSAIARRRRAIAVLALAVLALHAALLWALAPAERPPGASPPALRAVVALRVSADPAPGPAPTAQGEQAAPDAPTVPPAQVSAPGSAGGPGVRPTPRSAAAQRSPVPAEAPPPPAWQTAARRTESSARPATAGAAIGAAPQQRADAAGIVPTPTSATAAPDAAVQEVFASPAPSPIASEAPIPVYPTRLPPPQRLRFEVQRGASVGRAELAWLRRDDGYELSLAGELLGRPILEAASRGAIDANGLAPLRHVERRRSRDVRAANFQRDAGIVTFSGPQIEHALVAGAQDRLSWMIQLPAIVAADPAALGALGARVTLLVIGARGDAEAWRFDAETRETLGLADGSAAETLRFARQPSRPYDRRVEVWLDPARGWLPVRLRFTPVPGGEATDLRLLAADPAG